jgi:hypothetical protein
LFPLINGGGLEGEIQSEIEFGRWKSDSGSACNNQRVHGEGEDISEGHVPQGCSLSCKCCGVECESIYAFIPKVRNHKPLVGLLVPAEWRGFGTLVRAHASNRSVRLSAQGEEGLLVNRTHCAGRVQPLPRPCLPLEPQIRY